MAFPKDAIRHNKDLGRAENGIKSCFKIECLATDFRLQNDPKM